MYLYLLLIISSFLLCIVIIEVLLEYVSKHALLDHVVDDPLKIHKVSIPLFGGIGIVIATFGPFLVVSVCRKFNLELVVVIILCGLLSCSFGLLDDVKWKNNHGINLLKRKVFLQALVGLALGILLFLNGIYIQFITINIVNILLVSLYIVAGMNAINLQDGMDGMAGGDVVISALGFIVLAYYLNNILALTLSLVLFGATLGFLIYNFPPASVFMGDNGSYFLGLMLVVLAIIFTSKPFDVRFFLGPILIIGLPVFDTAYAIFRRVIRKKPIFIGDRGHLYDQLIKRGYSAKQTLFRCYLTQAIFVVAGLLLILKG